MIAQPPPPAATVRPAVWPTGIATAALAAAVTVWAALPLRTGAAGTRIAVIFTVGVTVLSIGRQAVVAVPRLADRELATVPERIAESLLDFLRGAQWAEAVVVGTLVLEALHPSRPWHTALLGVALLAYLLAIHLAETRSRPRVLRAQLPVLAAGCGLLAIAVGAAYLPALPSGASSAVILAIAIIATAVIAAISVRGTWRGGR
jgi:hypothetical protein